MSSSINGTTVEMLGAQLSPVLCDGNTVVADKLAKNSGDGDGWLQRDRRHQHVRHTSPNVKVGVTEIDPLPV